MALSQSNEHLRLNLHAILEHSTENGPGTRAVIWTQGCLFNCPGCFNPETHDLRPRHVVSVAELAAQLLAIADIEGLTVSGGEPFLQAEPLAELCRKIREAGRGVIVFTGYEYHDLIQANNPAWNALLAVTDLLIAGPFRRDLACDLALRGSRNQTLHFLSDRYAACREQFERLSNSVEVLIDETGQVTLTGFPSGAFGAPDR